MAEKKKFSRRKFIIRGGLGTIGVVSVGTYLSRNMLRRTLLETMESTVLPYDGTGTEANLWFELTKENTLIFHSPKVEMGQGTFTGLAQMIAEEMDLTMEQIQVKGAESASGVVDGMATGGSLSIAGLWQPLREMAVMMREMIKLEASKKMGADLASLTTKEGTVVAGNKTMTYAQIAEGVTEWEEPSETPAPKTSDFKFIGKPIPRIDLKEKVFGAPIYGLDAELPDMLFAAIIRPDRVGATFKSADTSKASKMPGVVKVVQIDDWIGIVAQSYPQALTAKNEVKVDWDIPEKWDENKLREALQVGKGDEFASQKYGSKLKDEDEKVTTMEFSSPIGAHAQMEPNGAVAHYQDGKVTIILSTQVVKVTREQVADALDLDEENVNIIPTQLGGGFGRRLNTYHAIQAAQLSKEVGKPVKYIFTRQEEFQNDLFRPPTQHIMKGKLGENGYLEALEHHYASGDVAINSAMLPAFLLTIVGTDIGASRGANIMYDGLDNRRTVQWHTTLPFSTSWWRSLGLLANTFAIESFIDEMALTAGKDPVDFRVKMLGKEDLSKRIKKVIEIVAEKAGYKEEASSKNKAMGFAASIDTGSPAAHVAEVSIEKGKIKVHKVTCAFDCGLAVNPNQVIAQCEGAITMGMSAAMFERMNLEDSELTPIIYGPYKIALMKHAPKEIDVHLIQGADIPLPVGEPPMGPIGAAIANAVRRLTGKRLTTIPLQEAYDVAMKEKETA